MEIVFVLLPLSLFLAGGALLGYLWSVRSGQFDDLDTPAHRILIDEEEESKDEEDSS
jgi:cbb3-type cytochrome oxidase maturation protein